MRRSFICLYTGRECRRGRKSPALRELKETEQKRLLGRRAARKATFEVTYYCGEEKTAAAECAEVSDGLYEALCIIGTEERFAASGIQEEKTETGIQFTAEYEYHVLLAEDAAEKMERLKYNGKEAVGYEEKGDIQQGTAE